MKKLKPHSMKEAIIKQEEKIAVILDDLNDKIIISVKEPLKKENIPQLLEALHGMMPQDGNYKGALISKLYSEWYKEHASSNSIVEALLTDYIIIPKKKV